MIYRATTTLKKADTDGRIPAYTLDQYVRGELCQQLVSAVTAQLTVSRTEADRDGNLSTVDFSTELILMTPAQWRQLKALLIRSSAFLPGDQQTATWQLMNDIDGQM